ncbi:histidine phosphatase family protein [Corynebacterium tapiri]|uniref:Histidine phosphatase family protein n=1 Tax=Corynebacterium tapiri TaxID=1448266 RepID=A0A5C4U4C4_9CORY|nr:histidine phosphatase family protein [Corynebacterium tapiri]TNL96629.1 histidine phosphatase family protein [Corynebacterium tapiri]
MSRRLILLRHGQTHYNATRRMQGQLDTDLAPAGLEGARNIAQFLASDNIARIISSDLRRAADTAACVGALIDVPVELDSRLRETHLGQWQGMSSAEVDEQHPGARAAWRHDPAYTPPGGESRLDVARRARPVIDELMADFSDWEGKSVLVVAHGGTISALTGSLLGFRQSMFPTLVTLKNTHCAVLKARPEFTPGSLDAMDDAAQEPEQARFHGTEAAQWYLEGWNVGGPKL